MDGRRLFSPVDAACLLKDFRSRSRFSITYELILGDGSKSPGNNIIDGAQSELCAEKHQSVMHISNVVLRGYCHSLLRYYIAGVDLMFEKKCSDTGFSVSVNHSPVYRGGSTITREQGSVEIKRAETRHGPHHFGKHPERNDHKQISIKRAQMLGKLGSLEVDRLHEMEPSFLGKQFYR